jgi:hypothetical protein
MTHEGMQFPRYSTLSTRVCGRCDHWSADPAHEHMGECRALPPTIHVELVPNALPWQQSVKVTKLYPPMHEGEKGCRALYRRRTAEAILEDRVRRSSYQAELEAVAARAALSSPTSSSELDNDQNLTRSDSHGEG